MGADSNIGKVVVAFTAPNPGRPHFVGVLQAYYACPVALIDCGDGRGAPWAMHLCRSATLEEAAEFWRRRALAAEGTIKELTSGKPPL